MACKNNIPPTHRHKAPMCPDGREGLKKENRRNHALCVYVCVLAHFAMVIQEDEADGGGTNAQWHDDEQNDKLVRLVDWLVERLAHHVGIRHARIRVCWIL